jgi:hypothetical protein
MGRPARGGKSGNRRSLAGSGVSIVAFERGFNFSVRGSRQITWFSSGLLCALRLGMRDFEQNERITRQLSRCDLILMGLDGNPAFWPGPGILGISFFQMSI